jgi:hypothetical protein
VGVYTEYLDRGMSFEELQAERKAQLNRMAAHRSRDVLVYAANLNPQGRPPISLDYSDLLPINDQLANLHGDALDLVLETPGGSGEIAEDIVKLLRGRYEEIGTIVPGCAKSAGVARSMTSVMPGERWRVRPAARWWLRLQAMPDRDYTLLFEKVEELRTDTATARLVAKTEEICKETDALAELLAAAQELQDAAPVFYTRA